MQNPNQEFEILNGNRPDFETKIEECRQRGIKFLVTEIFYEEARRFQTLYSDWEVKMVPVDSYTSQIIGGPSKDNQVVMAYFTPRQTAEMSLE